MYDVNAFPQIHPARLPRRSAMLHQMCFYPVLVTQGPITKARTPRLPEPTGPREGTVGQGRDLRLLITGDSSAVGVGVQTQDDALSGQLTGRLAKRSRVDWQLVAKCGNTTPATLAQLHHAKPRPVDVAVVGLGVNDITSGTTLTSWLHRTDALIDHLRDDLGAQHIYFSGIPPLWQFPVLQNPLRWTLGHQAERFDRALRQHLSARGDATWITLDLGLNESNMAADGYHPDATVYAQWARALHDRICLDLNI